MTENIRVYNTLSNRKEEFYPLKAGEVTMYVCGPTVYDLIHIGNGRCYVAFDVIRRYLTYRGFEVKYVVNITDIDDKIIARSLEEGRPAEEIAEECTDAFFQDIDSLGVLRADVHPKATTEIDKIIAAVAKLVHMGLAYESDGDVYFSVDRAEDYGQLSGVEATEVIAGSRVDILDTKRNPKDFTLWKAAKPGEPSWESPWGPGRPGWHIECSVMSNTYLGPTIDIHGGGQDLIFPHHENEIQQSQGINGQEFVRYWLHNGFLNMGGEKMSKSLGNLATVRAVLEQYHPRVVRFYLMNTQYRKPIDYTREALDEAQKAYRRMFNAYFSLNRQIMLIGKGKRTAGDGSMTEEIEDARKRIVEAMDNDFNSREALGIIFEVVRSLQGNMTSLSLEGLNEAGDLFAEMDRVFGLFPQEEIIDCDALEEQIELREEFRAQKDWGRSDEIRDSLLEKGVHLKDGADGTEVEVELRPICC